MTIPIDALAVLLSQELALNIWPFFRIAGVMMVAPVFGARLVPVRVRLALSVALTVVLAPVLPTAARVFEPSLATGLVLAQELLLGVAMGFCLQMIFDALIIAGQTIAMGMGLGFATMVDPQRGVSVPVIGQFFVILGMLIFLALGGHLATLRLLADSFELLPLGDPFPMGSIWLLISWGSEMFAGAVRIALPAATALLVVNIAFGVMSRAAPTLNLFAVGLPAGLLLGFLILMVSIDNLNALMAGLLTSALATIGQMLGA
jgi:flagellar biosynthetic protein FliR